MPTHPKRLALDTHIWIWYVNGGSEIKPKIREIIYRTLQEGTVLVPAICVWEIGMLWRNNRIQLAQPITEWVHDALDKTGFVLSVLSENIALEATMLPGNLHKDPADNMIIATARLEGATLVTRDSRIISYAQAGHVSVIAA